MTRRHLQIALGLVWLLDGGLQLQPFMLGTGFAEQIIAPTAAGQPHLVAAAAGSALALSSWVVGQNLGQLYSGRATDPNTAPVIALLAMTILGGRRARVSLRARRVAVDRSGDQRDDLLACRPLDGARRD